MNFSFFSLVAVSFVVSQGVFASVISDPASAQLPVPTEPISLHEKVSGTIWLEPSSRYTRHGITPGSVVCEGGSFGSGFEMVVDTKSKFKPFWKFSQINIKDNRLFGLEFNDQSDAYLGMKAEDLWPGMYASLGFSYISGGMAGLASQYREYSNIKPIPDMSTMTFKALNGQAGYDHDTLVTLVLMQKARLTPKQGVFVVGSVSLSLDSTEGWLTNFGIGHAYKVSEKFKLVTTAMSYFSYRFWGGNDGVNYNGSDGFALNLEAPYNIFKELIFAPYIGMTWSGHNPLAINRKEIIVKGFAPYRPFQNAFENYAIVWGVRLKWSF